jgi:hypothetical protein
MGDFGIENRESNTTILQLPECPLDRRSHWTTVSVQKATTNTIDGHSNQKKIRLPSSLE